MSKTELRKIIEKYGNVLKKNRIEFKQIYLFGSHANGKATKDSDIDVAVVISRLPRGRRYLDKKMRLWELAPEADIRIEPILLEESELKPDDISIMGNEVRKHGILVVDG